MDLRTVAKTIIKRAVGMRHGAAVSYSSAGEDMILRHLLGVEAASGTYVDVGAWHPTMASNSYYFYRCGWSGVTIEPQSDMAALHRKVRPRDFTVDVVAGRTHGPVDLFVPAEGSAMAGRSPRYFGDTAEVRKVLSMPLSMILDMTMASKSADLKFMSIDVEGDELDVLESNDWERYRPWLVCVETGESVDDVESFLSDHGYSTVATNSIIIDEVKEVFAADDRRDWKTVL